MYRLYGNFSAKLYNLVPAVDFRTELPSADVLCFSRFVRLLVTVNNPRGHPNPYMVSYPESPWNQRINQVGTSVTFVRVFLSTTHQFFQVANDIGDALTTTHRLLNMSLFSS